MHEKIVILDFGGQYAHLIASRIRREQVLAEIFNPDEVSLEFLKGGNIKGIILSGGPQSVFEKYSPKCDPEIFKIGKPVLGICYGHQYLNDSLGGIVTPGKVKEYGRAKVRHDNNCPLFKGIPESSTFWMSHGDEVTTLAEGFEICGSTDHCENAAVWNVEKNLFGIQFHPEVTHSAFGNQLLKNFLDICEVSGDWTIEKFLEEHSAVLKEKIGDKNVFLFVSGGVDSTVCFAFLSKILGADRVKGLFVNTGLLRKWEVEFVERELKNLGADLTILHEEETFLNNLKGAYDPEKKRSIIGNTFLEVQNKYFAANDLHDDWILAQGTIYPDTIESGGTKNASKIKTHHNRVPEIQKLIDEGKVIEPIAELYKDEVRALGETLGLPYELVWRHPFPGPGLGVRILCSEEEIKRNQVPADLGKSPLILPIKSVGVQGDARTYRHPAIIEKTTNSLEELEEQATQLINKNSEINRVLINLGMQHNQEIDNISVQKTDLTNERVEILQRADHVITMLLQEMNCYEKVWQFPVVLVPISFNEKGKEVIILRPINSIDAMSASVGKLSWEFFEKATQEILKDKNISAVLLDITSKPPGTIEWE